MRATNVLFTALLWLPLHALANRSEMHENIEDKAARRRTGTIVNSAKAKRLIREGEKVEKPPPYIGFVSGAEMNCTGTLWPGKPCIVLLADHCVANEFASDVKFSNDLQRASGTQIIRHPENANGRRPDIALLVLSESIDTQGQEIAVADKVPADDSILSGFGYQGGATLKSGEMKLLEVEESAGLRNYKHPGLVFQPKATPKNRFVNRQVQLCPGDSGGPVVDAKGKLVGVNSSMLKLDFNAPFCVSDCTEGKEKSLCWVDATKIFGAMRAALDLGTNGFNSTQKMCESLNDPKKILANKEKIQIQLRRLFEDEAYVKAGWENLESWLAPKSKNQNYRLPTEKELQTHFKDNPPDYRHAWTWTSSKGEKEGEHVALSHNGTTTSAWSFPEIPSECDRGFEAAAVSLIPFVPWIQEKAEKVTCPAAKKRKPE